MAPSATPAAVPRSHSWSTDGLGPTIVHSGAARGASSTTGSGSDRPALRSPAPWCEEVTMAETTHHQALGRYGEALAARHLVERGMVVLDRNWRCPLGEIDLVLRDGDTLVVCEVKTRTSHDYGSPHEALTAGQARADGPARRRLADGARRDSRGGAPGPRRGAPPAPGTVPGRARARALLMPFATTHTVSLHGAQGHLIDVQSDVSPGQVGVTLVGRPDTSLNEARDRCRMALLNSRAGLAGDQAHHHPAVAGRPAQERHPLRPGHRGVRAGRRRRRADCRPHAHRVRG